MSVPVEWRKSSRSGSVSGSDCVEVAVLGGTAKSASA
jgi:hypothetical protein